MISETDILGAKILIVDDQEVNVVLLEQLLRETGYTCVSSTMNPREVFRLHRENAYDHPARPPDAQHGRLPGHRRPED